MQRSMLIGLILISILGSSLAKANTGKEFTTSVIYGTLAGTLVGAATLAFTSNPGDNLNNVARGASYGLYAGILLGLYVTYGVSDGTEPEKIQQEPGVFEGAPPPSSMITPPRAPAGLNVALVPVIQKTGAQADWGAAIQFTGIHF